MRGWHGSLCICRSCLDRLDLTDEQRVDRDVTYAAAGGAVAVVLLYDNEVSGGDGLEERGEAWRAVVANDLMDGVTVARGHVEGELKSHRIAR